MRRGNGRIVPERGAVLTKAVVRVSRMLGLKDVELAQVIGASPATVSRYRRGAAEINPERKIAELALLLIHVFRSLDSLVGADGEKRKAWMHTPNNALGGVPAMLIRRPEGLVQTLTYLDVTRTRV